MARKRGPPEPPPLVIETDDPLAAFAQMLRADPDKAKASGTGPICAPRQTHRGVVRAVLHRLIRSDSRIHHIFGSPPVTVDSQDAAT
jgi:hypothetical protein